MSVLKIKDENGVVHEILAIKGEKGDSYVLTEEDKQEIAGMVSGGGSDVDLSKYYTTLEVDIALDRKADKSELDQHVNQFNLFKEYADAEFDQMIKYSSLFQILKAHEYQTKEQVIALIQEYMSGLST